MSKNNNQDFMGCDTAGYKDIKLLDIQPLHPGMTVMVIDTDEDDNVVMRDCVETGNSYCLALVEENGERAVYPFALSTLYGLRYRCGTAGGCVGGVLWHRASVAGLHRSLRL